MSFIFVSLGVLVLETSVWFETTEEDFKSLIHEVETDPKYNDSMQTLLSYAAEQVALHQQAIKENMVKHGVQLVDSIYPGDGYNSVAYGGSYEVLTLLEKEGILKVGSIMGASGGAASAFLALSDTSAKKLLKYYMIYSLFLSKSWDLQLLRTSKVWDFMYEHAISDEESFKRVQERGYAVTKCGIRHYLPLGSPTKYNLVLHNCTSVKQCVESFAASGAFGIEPYTKGASIDGVSEWFGTCSDAAAVTYFPKSSGSLLYYGSFYGHVSDCTLDSIDELFRNGVDATIATLISDQLTGREEDTMQLVPKVTPADFEDLKNNYPGSIYPYICDDEKFLDLGVLQHL